VKQKKLQSNVFYVEVEIQKVGGCCIFIAFSRVSDPDPGGRKWPTKIEKSPEFSCF
jgi:hypothetical protein